MVLARWIRFYSPWPKLRILMRERIVNVDLLTYAANLKNLSSIENDPRYCFVKGDINDTVLIEKLCLEHKEIECNMSNFAAESHVDRSIDAPLDFFNTNVKGTLSLLEVMRRHPTFIYTTYPPTRSTDH